MDTVILKNGAEEAKPLVSVTMLTLRNLMEENPIAFFELVELSRDRDHKLFGNTGEVLSDKRLVTRDVRGDTVHDSIRNIILSSIEGDGLDLTLDSPLP